MDFFDLCYCSFKFTISIHGGGIYALNSCNVTIKNNSEVNSNMSGDANGNGGGMFISGNSKLIVTDSSFSGNHCFKTTTGGYQGGAIYIEDNSTLDATKATFNVEKVFNTGGAIKVHSAKATINESNFNMKGLGDAYGISGGAICSEGSQLDVNKTTFTVGDGVNKVTHAGGVIDIVGSGTFNLSDSNLISTSSNTEATFGGAISFEGLCTATATIKNTTIKGFKADTSGGAISISNPKNEAANGGKSCSVTLTIDDSTLDTNKSWGVGGGIAVFKGNTVIVNNSVIQKSYAKVGSGIANCGDVTLDKNSKLLSNGAGKIGGGVYNTGVLKVVDAVFTGNSANSGVNSVDKNEYSGENIYAAKDVIVYPDAQFDEKDIRVIDKVSSVVLAGNLKNNMNVSISEKAKKETSTDMVLIDEPAERYIGYLVAKGDGKYEPIKSDVDFVKYISRDPNVTNDKNEVGKWTYVYNPTNKTIVVGQRAKLVYHANGANAKFSDNSVKKDQIYDIYSSLSPWSDPVQLTEITEKPTREDYNFAGWYSVAVEDTDVANNVNKDKFDFTQKFINSTEPYKNLISPSLLNVYAGWLKVETIDVSVVKKWSSTVGDSVTVILEADGIKIKEAILSKDNNWKTTFSKLKKRSATGAEIKYTIKEVKIPGYTTKITGNQKDGFVVTNTPTGGGGNPGGGSGGGGNPPSDPKDDRVDGEDRIETAIEISKKFFGKTNTVIVVREDLFPDSMTATVLSKLLNAPILLTPTNKLDERVKVEIKRLGATKVIIVGGPDSVSNGVKEELRVFDKDVERLSGPDRYDTSDKVARRVVGITGKLHKSVIASGEVFPDALSVSSFAAKNGYPILLVRKNSISDTVNKAFKDLEIKDTYVVGSFDTISEMVEKKLPNPLERMGGKDRYATSVIITERKFKDSNRAFIASGEIFADALVIGPVAGKYEAPILLVKRSGAPDSVLKYVEKSKLNRFTAVGGTKYVPNEVMKQLLKR